MARVTKEQIERAKQLDLLTYMRLYEPHELVRKGNDYCTKEHDSLSISKNGLWHWFSRGIGGKTALQYLISVKDMDFVEAVLHLCCDTPTQNTINSSNQIRAEEKRQFVLPEAYKNNDRVVEYLRMRGISQNVIDHCIENKLLYESADYHNAVFVGYDQTGVARYAALRGTWKHKENTFKGEVAGSDKRFSFSVPAIEKNNKLVVTESAIDALSVATIQQDVRKVNYLSIGGAYSPKKIGDDANLPKALKHYLKTNHEINLVNLALDNDEIGLRASYFILNKLKSYGYFASLDLPIKSKDWNIKLLQL